MSENMNRCKGKLQLPKTVHTCKTCHTCRTCSVPSKLAVLYIGNAAANHIVPHRTLFLNSQSKLSNSKLNTVN